MDRKTGELRFEAASGLAKDELRKLTVPIDSSIAGWIFRKGTPLLIRDVKNDERWNPNVDDSIDFETESILGVPLKVKNQTIGVMELINKINGEFTQDDIQIASHLAAQAAIAIENARLLEQLRGAYDELAELDRLKSDFVAIASHELRTPLSIILGYATFLRDDAKDETASSQIDIVLQSALRLRSIIDDMVNLRHVETGELQLESSTFSLKELIDEVTHEFGVLAEAKRQSLSVSFHSEDELMMDADRQKIYMVIANIISNAIKFTPENGKILVEAYRKGNEVWMHFIDSGVGIPKRDWDRIFNRFFQVEPSLTRRYEGMGLGLSIAKEMLDLHKGRIWVESVEGKGSRFTVVVPFSPFT
jgi:signal transduction histidine kinase